MSNDNVWDQWYIKESGLFDADQYSLESSLNNIRSNIQTLFSNNLSTPVLWNAVNEIYKEVASLDELSDKLDQGKLTHVFSSTVLLLRGIRQARSILEDQNHMQTIDQLIHDFDIFKNKIMSKVNFK